MASRTLGGIGLAAFWTLGEDGWNSGMDSNLLRLSSLVMLAVKGRVAALPGSPAAGDRYILTTDNSVNVYDAGAWVKFSAVDGWLAWDAATLEAIMFTTADGWVRRQLHATKSDKVSAGFRNTNYNLGSISSGNVAPDAALGNFQRLTNAGAFQLDPPTTDGDFTMLLLISNSATAGAVTIGSGYTKVIPGDTITTTSGSKFLLYLTKIDTVTTVFVVALQ